MLAKFAVVCAVLALASANAQKLKQNTSDPVSDAMPTIRLANSDWITAMRGGDADAIAKPYALDAIFVTPDGNSIRGRAQIRNFYRSRLSGKSSIISAKGGSASLCAVSRAITRHTRVEQ